jgi:chitodextrinase
VAEDDDQGGGKGTLNLPKLGAVKKKPVLIIGGVAAAYVVWRYWQASQAGATDAGTTDADGDGYADEGTIPAVTGQGPVTGYAPADDSGKSSDSYGFNGTTNSQWSQYATTQLSGASDKWSFGDIVAALGAYLANKPLTATQQEIVQAAKAVAGEPPEGTHPIIPGGDVPITVAPTGLKVVSTTTTSVTLSWNPVAGAGYYRAYRSGASNNVGATDGTTITIDGLKPNTDYSFQVAADTTSGKPGPKSAAVHGKTKAVTLAKPGNIKISSVSKTTAKVSWSRVAGADYYRIYVNGTAHGSADGGLTSYTITGLKPNTAYKVAVAADTTNQTPGPQSGAVSFRTKK